MKFDLWWLKLVSMVAMICLFLCMLVLINLGRDSEEEEVMEIRIPPGSDGQRIWYLSRVAEMFYVTMTGQHDEYI